MENQTPEEAKLNLNMSMDDFEGTTVHLFQVFSNGTEARLDCIYADFGLAAQGADEIPGKIVARLNMSTDRLAELRDALNSHFENTAKPE